MSSNVLFYLAVGRLVRDSSSNYAEGKHVVVASAVSAAHQEDEKDYRSHVKQIMDKGSSKLKPDKRIRLSADDNNYDLHVMAGSLGDTLVVYFAVTDPGFGKAHSVASLLDDLKNGLMKNNTDEDVLRAKEKGSCHKASQGMLNNLLQKYGEDKLRMVQSKVDDVKGIMKDNVAKALDNVESLDELENKSENFENQARQFEKSATNVKKMMRCQYWKTTALIVGIVLLILIIIIATQVNKNKN